MTDAPPDRGKRASAEAAIALVQDDMRLGLGTGSTMQFAIEALARRVREDGLRVACVPTSLHTEQEARRLGIPLIGFADCDWLDLAIDGADEVQLGTLALIKGLGGALLREKIVAVNSRRFVAVADASKLVRDLGSHAPLPVEVTRFGWETVARHLRALGADPVLRQAKTGEPLITDGGNHILDCRGFAPIADPAGLQQELCSVVGVVETGLFAGMAESAIIADGDAVQVIHRQAA